MNPLSAARRDNHLDESAVRRKHLRDTLGAKHAELKAHVLQFALDSRFAERVAVFEDSDANFVKSLWNDIGVE